MRDFKDKELFSLFHVYMTRMTAMVMFYSFELVALIYLNLE